MSDKYQFTAKTRAEKIDYILNRSSRSYDYGHSQYMWAWDVKVYPDFSGDNLRKHIPELNPAYDERWDEICENDNGSVFYNAIEDAQRDYAEGEWCSYPGNDQGDWKFGFEGRSGGWLVLTEYRGKRMDRSPLEGDMGEFCSLAANWRWLFELPLEDEYGDENYLAWDDDKLDAFYRGIVTADVDFTPENATANVEYYAAHYRLRLEEEWDQEVAEQAEAFADDLESSRPDMYAGAGA